MIRCQIARKRRAERGVAAPEYGLIIGVAVLSLGAGLSFLSDRASEQLVDTRDSVASGEMAPAPTPTTGGGGPTTTAAPTTTTTVAPTTTSTTLAPTTTTSSTTSTTLAPTTTSTTAPPSANGSATTSAIPLAWGFWRASETVTITSSTGQPVAGAAVTVRTRTCTSTSSCSAWTTTTITTDSAGHATTSRDVWPSTVRVDVEVTSVVPGGGMTFTGTIPSASISRPYS